MPERRKKPPARRPQRVRTLKLKTQTHPDALMPLLYGERDGPVNAIMLETGCSIDYCALSPDERDAARAGDRPHTMTFLVSAETPDMLDEVSRRLRVLVGRVQTQVQQRVAARKAFKRANGAEAARQPAGHDRRYVDRVRTHDREAELVEMQDGRLREPSEQQDASQFLQRGAGRPRTVDDVYGEPAQRYARNRTPPNMEMDHTVSSEHYREGPRMRAPSNIYYESSGPAHYTAHSSRFRSEVGLEETKRPALRSSYPDSARSSASENVPTGIHEPEFGSQAPPYARRREPNLTDRPPWGPVPANDGYIGYGPTRITTGRARRRRSFEHGEYADNPAPHAARSHSVSAHMEEAPIPSRPTSSELRAEDVTSMDQDELGVPMDVEPEWPTQGALRRYLRPAPEYYIRTEDGYMKAVPPPSPAYYYRYPAMAYSEYADYDDYGGYVGWAGEDDEAMYAYNHPMWPPPYAPHAHSSPRDSRRFAAGGPYQMWRPVPESLPARLVKRQKVSYERDPGVDEEENEHASRSDNRFAHKAPIQARRSPNEQSTDLSTTTNIGNEPLQEENSSEESFDQEEADGDSSNEDDNDGPQRKAGAATESFVCSQLARGCETSGSEVAIELRYNLEPTSSNRRQPQGRLDAGHSTEQAPKDASVSRAAQVRDDPTPIREVEMEPPAAAYPIDATTTDTGGDISIVENSNQERDQAHSSPQTGQMARGSGAQKNLSGTANQMEPGSEPSGDFCESDARHAMHEPNGKLRALPLVKPESMVVAASTPLSASIEMNNRVSSSLLTANQLDSARVQVKNQLAAQKKKYYAIRQEAQHRQRLGVLLKAALDLQCRLVASNAEYGSARFEALQIIKSLLESTFESKASAASKVKKLQKGLESILSVQSQLDNRPNSAPPEKIAKEHPQEDLSDDGMGDVDDQVDARADLAVNDQANCAVSHPEEELPESDQFDDEDLASQMEGVVKVERALDELFFKQEDAPLQCPTELPSFVWTFLMHSLACDASHSYVMKVMHKRLLEEITKSNPYYYLHRSLLRPGTRRLSEVCEFGCHGVSATKWERKLISQINSRMKSFDSAAYSLARSAGGKDVLNRKKLNSIIRKVHLVAMQVHSLLSHLYCLKGCGVCSDVDSMPSALNNSYFEKRMGVYKSRLKLVFPNKQQPTPPGIAVASKEPEDLVRDTFEFFPELLVCVDIWGYNYREALIKRQRSTEAILQSKDSDSRKRVGETAKEMLPMQFFRAVEGRGFDFDNDANGRLRCICDELLNIVCLWNDFKWMENLDALDLERISTFESGVGGSIMKILTLYASHLQALWAARILEDPDYLLSARLTQHNAYYTPRSHMAFAPGNTLNEANGGVPPSESVDPSSIDDEANKEQIDTDECTDAGFAPDSPNEWGSHQPEEQTIATMYWERKSGDSGLADGIDEDWSLIVPDEIRAWSEPTLFAHLLKSDEESALQAELEELSVVAEDMLASHSSVALVSIASRHRLLSTDIVRVTEKLALHSAAHQVRDEKNHLSTSIVVRQEFPTSSGDDDLRQGVGVPWSSPDHSPLPNVTNDAEVAFRYMNGYDEDQPVRDVIEVLAATKKQLQELCTQRARSARVREKLQTQAAQLTRQAAELVRNTAQMYT